MKLNQKILNLSKSLITQLGSKTSDKQIHYDLNIGEPLYHTPLSVKFKTIKALLNNKTTYAKSTGINELKEKIISYENTKNRKFSQNQIIITNGATEALYLALSTIIRRDDEIIVPVPAYSVYQNIIELNDGKMIEYQNKFHNYQFNQSSLERLITTKTKAIIINSPHNPTGTILTDSSFTILKNLALKYKFMIIFDNCYEQILYQKNLSSFNISPEIQENIIICNSFSKPYAMTGWRLGYLVATKFIIEQAEKLHQCINVSLNHFCQYGALQALNVKTKKRTKHYQYLRNYTYNRLKEIGFKVKLPDGAFYLYPQIPHSFSSSFEFCEKLFREKGVLTTPSEAFNDQNHFRICFARNRKTLKKALKLLESFYKENQKS